MQHFQRRPCAKAAGRVALQAIRPRVMLMPADIDGHNEEIKVTTHDQALEMAMSDLGVKVEQGRGVAAAQAVLQVGAPR